MDPVVPPQGPKRHPIEDRDFTPEEMKDPHRYTRAFDAAFGTPEQLMKENARLSAKLDRLEIAAGSAGPVAQFGQLILDIVTSGPAIVVGVAVVIVLLVLLAR